VEPIGARNLVFALIQVNVSLQCAEVEEYTLTDPEEDPDTRQAAGERWVHNVMDARERADNVRDLLSAAERSWWRAFLGVTPKRPRRKR
jgi:hypothetical protein